MLDTAFNVLKMIEDNSYEAYIIGGFVRDYIMGINLMMLILLLMLNQRI